MVVWRYDIYLLVLKDISLDRCAREIFINTQR